MTNKRVAILTFFDVALFELACATELFALARPEFSTWYDCDVVSFESEPLSTSANMYLQAKQVSSIEDYDMLIVPSWPIDRAPEAHLATTIRDFVEQGKRIVSFCSGAFLLAKLGLFDNRQATTHWRYAESFKAQFPDIEYVEDVLYLFDGQVGCSAGSAAGIDLGLAIIRQDFGYVMANQVARRLVVSAHRTGGQSQFVETPLLNVPNQFADALDWALSHLDQTIDIDQLATKANMSRRTFDRKFRSSFNMSAKTWLTQQRLEKAKALLEQERISIEQVAELSGFDNATSLRHHFRKVLSISPNQYRQQFLA